MGGFAVSDGCPQCQQPLRKTWEHLHAPAAKARVVTPLRKRLMGAAIMFVPAALVLFLAWIGLRTKSGLVVPFLILAYLGSLAATLCVPVWLRRQDPLRRFIPSLGVWGLLAFIVGVAVALIPPMIPFIAIGMCFKEGFP